MKRMLTVLAAVMTAAVSMAATITVDQVRQRYPWNGKVDIDYTVTYAAGEDPIDPNLACVDVQAIDETVTPFVTNFCWTLIPARPSVAAGKHRMTWDAAADGCKTDSDNLRIKMTIETAPDDYVRSGLIGYWDGINNAGTGTHDATATVWKDLAGTCDMTLTANGSWNTGHNGLVVNGRSAVAAKTVSNYKTIEVVYKMTQKDGSILLSTGTKNRYVLFDTNGTCEYFDGEKETLMIPRTFDASAIRASAAVYNDAGNAVGSVYAEGIQEKNDIKHTNTWGTYENVLQLGSRSANAGDWKWYGEVYSVRLYDRALTAQELAYNHRRDLVRFYGAGSVDSVSAESEIVRVDLRTGIRTVSKRDDILPFAWSSKNFTSAIGDDYATEGLIGHWDGINNTGTGTHDATATAWKDLAGTCDMALTDNGSWNAGHNGLVVNGRSAVAAKTVSNYKTIEIAYKMTRADGSILLSTGIKSKYVLFDTNGTCEYFDGEKETLMIPRAFDATAFRTSTAVYNDAANTVESVYAEGVQEKSGTTHLNTWGVYQSNVLQLGSRSADANDWKWYGEVYSVRLYDRALTPEQIAHNHFLDIMRFCPEETVAVVKIARLTGTDEDLTKWTDEVAGSERTLIRQKGEGGVQWRAKPGVWRAFYQIQHNDQTIYEENCLFDLRSLPPMGLFLVVQ